MGRKTNFSLTLYKPCCWRWHDFALRSTTTMASSTTATTSYVLNKYSRSYPKSSPAISHGDLEWQHFSNPVIRLVLDVKKSSDGTLESLRLRIMWSMFSGPDFMDTDQQEMTFVRNFMFVLFAVNYLCLRVIGRFGPLVVFLYRYTPKSTIRASIARLSNKSCIS